jgi:hypothetical protein
MTLRTSSLAALAVALLPGCYVEYDDGPPPPPANSPPVITYADAGCEWDDYYQDYVWFFEADADDADGPGDVAAVTADVYDEADDSWVDGFDLYPEEGITWYSAWVGSSTYLECGYPGYSIDLTAFDSFQDTDVVTVVPAY